MVFSKTVAIVFYLAAFIIGCVGIVVCLGCARFERKQLAQERREFERAKKEFERQKQK